NYGTFPIQVCNGTVCSNIVNYNIDNASGYWLLNSNGSISNTNNNGVNISWLSRGAPVTINSTYTSTTPYIVPNIVNWITCNTNSGDVYIALPSATEFTGREIMLKRIGTGSITSTTGIIQSFDTSSLSSTIMSSSTNNYSWITLVFDGTKWLIMKYGQ
ncbi:hypothetical protein EBU24_06350, partial [bacterium]|nr:hypothetical protein [bacterium]